MKKGYKVLIFLLILLLILSGFLFVVRKVRGATNIDSINHWAWNDVTGWIDLYVTNAVTLDSNLLQGYANTSSIGDISFDCATGPSGSSCAPVNYQVSNDGGGNLSGWAWSEAIGWISFCGNLSGGSTWNGSKWICPAGSTYQTKVNSEGLFSGWAWSDVVGWISFNCNQVETGDTCGVSNYKTSTTWRPTGQSGSLISSTFDTGRAKAAFNYLLWKGDSTGGGTVCFQFAASDSPTGPWDFTGSDGTNSSYYCPPKDAPVALSKNVYGEKRYFRYKIFITTNAVRSFSPVVTDVIVNWSP